MRPRATRAPGKDRIPKRKVLNLSASMRPLLIGEIARLRALAKPKQQQGNPLNFINSFSVPFRSGNQNYATSDASRAAVAPN
jgi:hypothetical protein